MRRWRDASRERAQAAARSPRQENLTAAFFGLYAHRPHWERYTRSMAYALEREPIHLIPEERLAGMLYQTTAHPQAPDPTNEQLWAPYSPWVQMRAMQEQQIEPYLRVGGAPGHVGWHWEWILERGIAGHMGVIRQYLAQARDAEARRLYRGALIVWQSVLRWNERHVAALEESGQRARGPERRRLRRLAALCRRVPRHPARDFREALQSFHLQHLVLMFENPYGGNGPGRLDVLLWPYLQRDLEAGTITWDEARDLILELLIRFEERLPMADGWVEAVMVGGTNADGSSAANPLSQLIIAAAMALQQTHPAVYVRLGRASPEDLVDLTTSYLLHGQNRAQVYNDDVCLPAIESGGVSHEDAVRYMAGGCMEISAQGSACDLNFSSTHNVAKTLELVINGGIDLLDGRQRIASREALPDFGDFEAFYAAFERELCREYAVLVRALDIASACYARYRPSYLLSSLLDDCLERGREQQQGGARYHDYGFAPLGITTAADSLSAIRAAVFDRRLVSAAELLAALRADFSGHETLRARLRQLPRFGVEDAATDALTNRVLQSVCAAAAAQRTRFGGRLKPMIFNFVWTPTASRELGARADGSRAGETIGHGLTPHSAAMVKGVTAAINSSTSLDCGAVTGGATTMWDMDERWINHELMKALLRAFMARGGMIFQGNTTSVRELEEAFAHPERHPHLIVRVGGFSARFTTLSRDVQQEIITRRRHGG